MRLRVAVLCFVIMTFPVSLSAGTNAYKCEVVEVRILSDEGTLPTKPGDAWEIGQTFHVDRDSGVILGDWLSNSGDGWQKSVIDRGNNSSDFKVLSLSQANLAIYLSVQEWSEKYPKPFLFVQGHFVMSGTCE